MRLGQRAPSPVACERSELVARASRLHRPGRELAAPGRRKGIDVQHAVTARDASGLAQRRTDPAAAAQTPSLPQNIEAEAALLGALMIDNRLVDQYGPSIQAITIKVLLGCLIVASAGHIADVFI